MTPVDEAPSNTTVVAAPVQCACGCGQETRLAPHTNNSRGWIKGRPIRFIQGHSNRLGNERAKRVWTPAHNMQQQRQRGRRKDDLFCARLLLRLRYSDAVRALYQRLEIQDVIHEETHRGSAENIDLIEIA